LDTLAAAQPQLQEVEAARAASPRFTAFSARSAIDHYKVALRFGPLPELEATAKIAADQLDPESEEPIERLARAAKAAAAGSDDARAQLEALVSDADARELLGEHLLKAGDHAAAFELWTELANAQPTSARALFGLSRAELGLGKPMEALRHAQRVSAQSPGHVGAPITMLEARRALRNTSDDGGAALPATDDLANAVRGVFAAASPGEAALGHCVLGELHSSQGRSGPAQQEFEAALVIDRTFVRALIGLGEVLHQVGRDSEALARFAAAAQEQPENLPAQLGIAKSQIRLAQLAEAKKTLTQLAAARPNHPEIIFWQGKAAQAVGEHDAALASYRAAIVAAKGSPESVEAYLALAKLQAELGQLAIAQETLSEARNKVPPSGPLYHALGEVAMSRADYAGAYEQFQKALDLDAGDTRARFMGAVSLTRLGRFEEALAAFTSVSQTDKDFPGLAVERGRMFEESGRNAEALAQYEAALAKTPDDPEVQIRVGCARMIAGQTASAEEMLEKVAKVRPRSAEANYCLGRTLFDLERYLDAMVRLERAVSIDPTRAIYHLYVGWVASEIGRQTDALAAFDDAIELDKGLADAYWQRGRLRLKQGAARDAIVDLERARQLKPSRYDALADLAVAYSDIGRMPKALALWEEAIANDPDNPTWHFRYGKMLSSAGNGALAAAHVKRAIELVSEAQTASTTASKPKPPLWLWQAHYLLARELGLVPAAVPQWQAYLRLAPHDDPYRAEAERSLRQLGQPWQEK
jgi:tetratricopeptide (TPR) repeat protein